MKFLNLLIIVFLVIIKNASSQLMPIKLTKPVFTPIERQVIGFSGNSLVKVKIGTPPQDLLLHLSFEDDSTYVFDESCAYSNECNQNKSLAYFQKSRSSTFFTENKLFDGSVLGRPGPNGIIGRDIIQFASLSFPDDIGLVTKSRFNSTGDGVIGLGINPDFDNFKKSYIFHLLQRFEYSHVGIVVFPNQNLSIQNNGMISFGHKLPSGCDRKSYYHYTSLTYPFKQWIFTVKSAAYDFITPSQQQYTATIRLGQRFTLGPDVYIDALFAYLKANQPDSNKDEFYITDNGPQPPDLQFYVAGFRITLKPENYLSEMTPHGRRILFKKKTQYYMGLSADWVFGDSLLQAYCVVFEYALVDSKIGFMRASNERNVLSINVLIICFVYLILLFSSK